MPQASQGGGFLDILGQTAASIGTAVGETVGFAGRVGVLRARELVSDFLDAPDPAPEYDFTTGGVTLPGRPLNDATGRLTLQNRIGEGRGSVDDRNAEGAIPTTNAGNAGFFGFTSALGGSGGLLLVGGGLAASVLLFAILRK